MRSVAVRPGKTTIEKIATTATDLRQTARDRAMPRHYVSAGPLLGVPVFLLPWGWLPASHH